MFRPLELFIGQRYTHSRRRNRFISFISFTSMLGIMLGVMVLITILSIMNGFEKELRDRILGAVAHVTVSGTDGKLAEWEPQIERLAAVEHVKGVAPYVKSQVMLTNSSLMRGVVVQGINPQQHGQVSDIGSKLEEGSFDDLTSRGYGIVKPIGSQEVDSLSAFVHIEDAARLFKLRKEISGIRLRLDDLFMAQSVSQSLQADLGDDFEVSDWGKEHGSFFRAVKTEKIAMAMILFLVVAVALFNLVASLVMAVNDKEADIAILRTFGLEPKRIMRIFMIQGSIIGIFGTLTGVLLGILLSLNIDTIVPFIENLIGRQIFPADVFYISEIPSDLHWNDVGWIAVSALIFSVLATVYPAWRASKVQPAESLRYE